MPRPRPCMWHCFRGCVRLTAVWWDVTNPYRQNTVVVRREWPRTSFWRRLRAWLPGGYWWRDRRPVCIECGRRGCEETGLEAEARRHGQLVLDIYESLHGRLLVKAGDQRGPGPDWFGARERLRKVTATASQVRLAGKIPRGPRGGSIPPAAPARGGARQGNAAMVLGVVRLHPQHHRGMARQGTARHGQACPGTFRQGKARNVFNQ